MVRIETVYELGDCRAVGNDGFVACELRSTSPHEPFYPDSRVEEYWLKVENDEVVSREMRDIGFEWRQPEVQFLEWLRANHPDIADVMYTAAGRNSLPFPEITSGSELFTQYLIEYIPLWRDATEGS